MFALYIKNQKGCSYLYYLHFNVCHIFKIIFWVFLSQNSEHNFSLNFLSTGWCQSNQTSTFQWYQCWMAPHGWTHYQRTSAGWLSADGDSIWDAQQVSKGNGLQPDVLWGQDSRTSCYCVLLAAALVLGHSGFGTGGNTVHHHHLHPEVIQMVRVKTAVFFG